MTAGAHPGSPTTNSSRVVEHIVYSLDEHGRFEDTAEHDRAITFDVPLPLAEEAVAVVRDLEPVGVGARRSARLPA